MALGEEEVAEGEVGGGVVWGGGEGLGEEALRFRGVAGIELVLGLGEEGARVVWWGLRGRWGGGEAGQKGEAGEGWGAAEHRV